MLLHALPLVWKYGNWFDVGEHRCRCRRMSFIADVWSKTAGCVSMPGCKKEKLALFVLLTLSGSCSGLWEVLSSSRHNLITWGVIHGWASLGWVINTTYWHWGRMSGKIDAVCPFMSLSGWRWWEREGGIQVFQRDPNPSKSTKNSRRQNWTLVNRWQGDEQWYNLFH